MNKSTVFNIGSALLLLCLIAAGVAVKNLMPVEVAVSPSVPSMVSPVGISDVEQQRLIEEASRQLRKVSDSYCAKQKALTLQTEKEIAEIIKAAESQAGERAAVDTRPFRGFKNASWCTYLAAKDDVFGSAEFTSYASKSMEPTSLLLSTALRDLQAKLAVHEHQSQALANLYQKETLDLRNDLKTQGVNVAAPNLSSIAKAIGSASNETRTAALAVALEAFLIKSTIAAIEKIIGRLVVREAGAMTTAATAVVADGPLPIGDAIGGTIAVVGTGMTAWDLIGASKALEALPGEVEASIRSELNRMSVEATTHLEALDRQCETYYRLAAQ